MSKDLAVSKLKIVHTGASALHLRHTVGEHPVTLPPAKNGVPSTTEVDAETWAKLKMLPFVAAQLASSRVLVAA